MDGEPRRSRVSRWVGLARLALVRLWTQATATATGRAIATVFVVGLTIALLLLVTGVGLALADDGIATRDDADVRIEPDDESTLSAVDGVERSRLGDAGDRAETIRAAEGVDHASPVLVETVTVRSSDRDRPGLVLAVGVDPGDEPTTVAGLPTDALDAQSGGSSDGSGTPVVASETAADRLDASAGDDLAVTNAHPDASNTWSVTAVEDVGATDDAPVVLVPLEDLQTIAGADDGDLADRMLVWGDPEAGVTAGEEAYPNAAVASSSSADPATLFDDDLALATSAIALAVGVVVCSLVVATTVGLAVEEDRRTLAILAAVGFSAPSRLTVVAITTLVTTAGGAILGVVLGIGGIVAVNELAGGTIASGTVAQTHPAFVPYAIGVALLSGLIAVPYPLAIAVRTNVLEEVGR